jgi:hypothetical protein
VAVLVDLEGVRPAVLDGVAEPVQRADARVAAPAEHQPAGHAHADHLLVDQVRGHPDQREVAALLADHLLPGQRRDEVGEALEGQHVAVVDQAGDRLAQACDLGHLLGCPSVECS